MKLKFFTNLRRAYQKRMRHFRWPRFLTFGFYWTILSYPINWLIENWKRQRLWDLVLGLPALIGLIGIPVFVAKAGGPERSVSADYFAEAKAAVGANQLERAEFLLTRVIEQNDALKPDAHFQLALVLEKDGQKGRALQLFRMLAPEAQRGNREAHRRLAMMLAEDISSRSEVEDIRSLHWHLSCVGDDGSPDLCMAWGRYYLALRDLKKSREYLLKAADVHPELWQTLGAIELLSGQPASAVTSYQRSADYLSTKLTEAPGDQRTRVDYATVLIKVGRLDDAKRILEEGKLLNPDGPWMNMMASVMVAYHDVKSTEQTPLSELLGYLAQALNYDPNHGGALNRLMGYATATVDGNVELKTVLARVIAEGKQPALAHLAMGNLCWLEKNTDQAMFHFQRAMELRDDMAVLMNNMAWLLATDEKNPDLERAMVLAEKAIQQRPNDPSFLDTRGTIFKMQKNWNAALNDLEKALPGIRNKGSVHTKLAEIYTELGMKELAEQHQVLAQQEELEKSPRVREVNEAKP